MTLNTSGAISLGGSTTGQSINLELGNSATSTVSFNDAAVKGLAGKTSSIVMPTDFYGKTKSEWSLVTTGSYQWKSMIWTGTQFVAINVSGIVSSPTGTEWTLKAPSSTFFVNDPEFGPVPRYPRSIAWNGSVYVGVGDSGAIWTSSDLTSWTLAALGDSIIYDYLSDVVWSGSLFVAVGSQKENGDINILTSTNGTTWTFRGFAPGEAGIFDLDVVAYGNGTFVAGGSSKYLYTSTNGTSWTRRTMPTEYRSPRDICWAGDRFLLCTTGDDIFTGNSTGTTWTLRYAGTNNLYSVGGNNTLGYVAGGDAGVVYTSADGITWTPKASGSLEDLDTIATSSTRIVIGTLGYDVLYK